MRSFIKKIKGLDLNGFELHALLLEQYTERYGLLEKARLAKPLGLYEVSHKERLPALSPLMRRIYDFRINRVEQECGIKLFEFLSLPTWMVEEIFATLRHDMQEAKIRAENKKQQLENQLNVNGPIG